MLTTLAVLLLSVAPRPPVVCTAWTSSFIAYGDSKTVANTWVIALGDRLHGGPPWFIDFNVTTPIAGKPSVIARGGYTVAGMKALVDADLAATTPSTTVGRIAFNLGANETNSMPTQAQWLADTRYVLDAFATKWPGVQVYLMRPWVRGHLSDCNTLAGWIDQVVSSRAFAHLGPDERIWLEGGDDGATMTADGIHYSAAGHVEAARQWALALGH